MKTIEISDSDYDIIMELSKELQTQTNNGQAFPYFWEASSLKSVVDFNDEGDFVEIYDSKDCCTYAIEDLAESEEDFWDDFVYEKNIDTDKYSKKQEGEFIEFIKGIKENGAERFRVYSCNLERKRDHNPSLFLSDVKRYCKENAHHLGQKPAPYSSSIWRMPKMEALVEIVLRMNKQPKSEVNHEVRRYVYNK